MSGYFSTLNTALKALQVQKKSLDVTGHNIANANTEGYSRQRAVHSSTAPYHTVGMGTPTGAGQVGTGVEITEITRMRDQFLDAQINEEIQSQGYWDKRYEGLHRIELIFNEPSDSSLGTIMNQFWSSLQDLSNNPEDPAVRETVKQTGLTLSDTFHSLHDQLTDYQDALNDDVSTMVDEVNSIASRIADLNTQVVELKGSGKNPNDLLDRRDLLLEDLNKIVNVQSREDERGNLNVSLGGVQLVSNDRVHEIEYKSNVISFKETGIEAKIDKNESGGELGGVIDIRDKDINNYLGRLNELAETFAKEFNTVHQSGYDYNGNIGEDFFVGDSTGTINAETINISNDIINDVNKIAAGGLVYDSEVVTINNIQNNPPGHTYEFKVRENITDPNIKFNYEITERDENGVLVGSPFTGGEYTVSQFNNSEEIDTDSLVAGTYNLNGRLHFKLNGAGDFEQIPGTANGDNASKLADVIKEEKVFDSGNSTMLNYYKSTIASIGVEGQRANQMVNNQSVLVDQLNNQRISVSGVSLDEEMANMIQYQQAYNAASKVVVTIDEMLNSLMGIIR